jgi:hypothetical protein
MQMEDPTGPPLTFHALRRAFQTSIAEHLIPEAQWADHCKALLRERTGRAHVDSGLVNWIVRGEMSGRMRGSGRRACR